MARSEGKLIVYGGTIGRIERLGELLSCGVYHSRVSTAEGKAQRLRAWIEGGGFIAATSALGVSVNVPDVRVVIYAGIPGRLRDYI